MGIFNRKKLIVTHDGAFHGDDVFAAAIVSEYFQRVGIPVRIVRSRDAALLAQARVVFDTGGLHDPSQLRFDHHQKGGAGARANGMPFAACGLVWQAFGMELCRGDRELFEKVDREIIQYIDAHDNGVATETFIPPTTAVRNFSDVWMILTPTWAEPNSREDMTRAFLTAAAAARDYLVRILKVMADDIAGAREIKRTYDTSAQKDLLILDRDYGRPLSQSTLGPLEGTKFYINRGSNGWSIEAVAVSLDTFEKKAQFPESWAGLKDSELEKVTGVAGATFCHNGRFVCKTKTKEAALALVEKALTLLEPNH